MLPPVFGAAVHDLDRCRTKGICSVGGCHVSQRRRTWQSLLRWEVADLFPGRGTGGGLFLLFIASSWLGVSQKLKADVKNKELSSSPFGDWKSWLRSGPHVVAATMGWEAADDSEAALLLPSCPEPPPPLWWSVGQKRLAIWSARQS